MRMAFESLTLTPFCMEILGVRKWIFQCFNSVFSAILVGIRQKICKNTSTFFIVYNSFADIPYFFSRARSTAGEGGTEKYQRYQPPYQPSTRCLDPRAGQLYLTGPIRLGQKSSIKGNTSISI